MPRYIHKKLNLAIANGQNIDEAKISLPAGTCVGMAAVVAGTRPVDFVDLTVLENGAEIVEGSDYQFFEKTNAGKWVESLRPMTFDCNRNVTVRLSANSNLVADFKLQVIFFIVQN